MKNSIQARGSVAASLGTAALQRKQGRGSKLLLSVEETAILNRVTPRTIVIFNPTEKEKEWNFRVGRGEHLRVLYANIAPKSAHHRINVELTEEGAEAEINGLFLLSGKDELELETHQLHTAPKTRSRLLVKSALGGSSQGVFKGLITMAKGANGSDAFQENRNLILGDQARASSNPFLEILADDVKCSHGVSTSPLDPHAVFYLCSRGIDEESAKKILMKGFFSRLTAKFEEEMGGEFSLNVDKYFDEAL